MDNETVTSSNTIIQENTNNSINNTANDTLSSNPSKIQCTVLKRADNIIQYESNNSIDKTKMHISNTDSMGFITTVVTGSPITEHGSYYYEVELITDGLIQVSVVI